jgi:hypothetical protein
MTLRALRLVSRDESVPTFSCVGAVAADGHRATIGMSGEHGGGARIAAGEACGNLIVHGR